MEVLPAASQSSVASDEDIEGFRPVPAVWWFAGALFLASFLMFLIEPMIAKMVLPLMGGAPMVWNTCVVFFQTTLVAGYACAHGATRLLGRRRHALIYAALLVLPFSALPIALPDSMMASVTHPVGSLLLTLTAAIGLPFLVLATSTSWLQTWFAATDHPGARDPYFLFAASNLGSLLALLLYPTLVEPMLSLGNQSRLWTTGYVVFALLALVCAALTWSGAGAAPYPSTQATPMEGALGASWRQRGNWVVLSLIPSSLLLGVTTYISTDIASVPLLWIVPLSIYLLTFVLAFGTSSNLSGATAYETMPLLVTALAVFLTPMAGVSVWFAVPLHLFVFAAAAMACHGRLAAERPGPSLLTEFYFWIAFGGLLGGLFNTLLAPLLFDSVVEYPLMILCACAIGPITAPSWRNARALDGIVPLAIFSLTAIVVFAIERFGGGGYLIVAGLALPAVISFSQSKRRVRFALSIASMLVATAVTTSPYRPRAVRRANVFWCLSRERRFFGPTALALSRHDPARNAGSGTRPGGGAADLLSLVRTVRPGVHRPTPSLDGIRDCCRGTRCWLPRHLRP